MNNKDLNTSPIRFNYYSSEESGHLPAEVAHWRVALRPRIWRPATDVYDTEDVVVVRVEIGGMREEDFSISLVDNYLSIRGFRSDTSERRAYHQLEIPFGEFSTDVEIPFPVDVDHIEAVYQNGFLNVVLPKARPHHIRVQE